MRPVSDILLATKLHIPQARGALVGRPRLLERLDEGLAQARRLTLVCAPAGYGKSTLLGEWAAQLPRAGVNVAWISLEEKENQPERFWSYFLAALSSPAALRQAGVGESMRQALTSPAPPPMEGLLAGLLDELLDTGERVVLVLDDLQAITDPQVHSDLVYLLDHIPPGSTLTPGPVLHLAVTSRMDPPWPLARWRARRELNELRAVDLRFSYAETVQLLEQVLKLGLSRPELSALQVRTEGWIAGLQLAALGVQGRMSAQGAQGVSRFIETFAGTNRFVMDYLMEEVLSQQPAERRDFLQATSLLDQFTAPLCDALLERSGSQSLLEQLEQANLFLIPLDEQRQWYRYHPLFADLLRKRLNQTEPAVLNALHRRAGQWYAQNNFLAQAISHALDAGDIVQVNEFISGNALAMAEHAELQDVLRYFEHIPEEEMCNRPWLCVAYAWVNAYVQPSAIDRVLMKAMQSVNQVQDAAEKGQLDSHLDAIWAYVAWVKGKADLALDFVHSAMQYLPEGDFVTRAHLLNLEGLCLQYLDHLPEAVQSFEAAVAASERTGRTYESFHAYTNWAFAEILQGRLHKAGALCQSVLSAADQVGVHTKRLPVLAYAYATLSIVQREWNQVEAAVALARQGLALAEQWMQADTLHFCLTCLSEALSAAGELEEALAANQRSLQLALSVSPWFVSLSYGGEILLKLAQGDLAAADRRFTQLEAEIEVENMGGMFHFVKAALLNAQGRFAESLSAMQEPLARLEQMGKVWNLVRLQSLQAVALQGLGRVDEALAVMSRLLSYAQAEGCVRLFVDQGAPMHRLLQEAHRRNIHAGYVNSLLSAFDLPAALPPQAALPLTPVKPTASSLPEPLSDRELQVLRLLDSPLTSEEIGRELYISSNTVRTHIKNIYAKLGVNRRMDAVRLARANHLF